MAPGADGLPAAEREVEVSARLADYARALPPRSVRVMRLGIRAFELLPFPWRFSRASLRERERFLERLSRSRSALHRELLMLMKTLTLVNYASDERVRARIGYEAVCAIDPALAPADVEPRTPRSLGDLAPRGDGEQCDVAIVGSGAGGAVAAANLAAAGLDVLVIEAGAHYDRRSYPSDPIEALTALYRDGGLTVAEGRPMVPTPVGRAIGGTTVVNSGTCLRAPAEVLRSWGAREGIDWSERLDPEYAQAEELMQVRRLDPSELGRNGQLVMEGAERLGLRGAPLARNAGGCVQCSSCPFGCRLDAKRGMHLTYLPRAVAAGARIRAGVEVRRVMLEQGRAVGLACEVVGAPEPDGDRPGPAAGRRFEVRARHGVIVAAGAFGTPELLLRSGLRHPELGKNLRLHPAVWVGGRFDREVRGWEGVMQSYQVDQWQRLGINMEATFTPLAFGAQWLPGVGAEHQRRMLEFDRLGSNGVHLSDHSRGRVRLARDGSPRISYRLTRADAEKLSFGIARAAEIWFAAGATEVYPQVSGNPVLTGLDAVADFEARPPRPSALRLEAFHPMGTARISADPARGVTDTAGAVRGAERLFVADASSLPTSLGVNPMMTIVALASRLSRDLAARLA